MYDLDKCIQPKALGACHSEMQIDRATCKVAPLYAINSQPTCTKHLLLAVFVQEYKSNDSAHAACGPRKMRWLWKCRNVVSVRMLSDYSRWRWNEIGIFWSSVIQEEFRVMPSLVFSVCFTFVWSCRLQNICRDRYMHLMMVTQRAMWSMPEQLVSREWGIDPPLARYLQREQN